jgi:hypothetical protein
MVKDKDKGFKIVLRLSHESFRLLDNALGERHGECDSRKSPVGGIVEGSSGRQLCKHTWLV